MNQQEYGLYVLGLIGEEPYGEDGVTEDELYGYFQSFMPEGQGVEKVFEPLEHGQALLARILPIYGMLDASDFEGEAVPGYFNGGRHDATAAHVQAWLLRRFSKRKDVGRTALRNMFERRCSSEADTYGLARRNQAKTKSASSRIIPAVRFLLLLRSRRVRSVQRLAWNRYTLQSTRRQACRYRSRPGAVRRHSS